MSISIGAAAARAGTRGIGLASLAISAACTACASSSFSSTGPEDQGTYSASVIIGADTTQLSGNAIISTTQNSAGMTLLVFYLWTGDVDGTSYNVIWFQRENLAQPDPGSYAIDDVGADSTALNDFLALYAFADTTAAATFHSVTGTLTIDASTFLEVSGAFELVGAFDEDSFHSGTVGDTVQVNGTFRAVRGIIN